MNKFIKKIEQSDKKREIDLDGRNLIIVGNNGAGKTSFLMAINNYIFNIISQGQYITATDLNEYIVNNTRALDKYPKESIDYINTQRTIEYYNSVLCERKGLNIDFISNSELLSDIQKGKFIFKFFDAYRRYSSLSNGLLSSLDELYKEFDKSLTHRSDVSNYFHRYLVSMSNYALIEKGAGELAEYERVSKIITEMEGDLQKLFDDKTLRLVFNRKKLTMEISQGDESVFALEYLPSGYASILAVYAELIMLAELSKSERADIRGVVLIDEIDAHLHVTVQKKAFEFFSNSFPNIQFIISTHSPFVVQSVSDAIIYNLSNNEKLEDLSAYSYSSIVKGLLGESGNSSELEKILLELDDLSKRNDFGTRFNEINDALEQRFDVLDARAKAIVMGARARHIDWEEAQGNV